MDPYAFTSLSLLSGRALLGNLLLTSGDEELPGDLATRHWRPVTVLFFSVLVYPSD